MKIAILAGFVPTQVGGTEIATCYLAQYLAKLGHQVHIITGDIPPTVSETEGIQIHKVRIIRGKCLEFLSFLIACLTALRKIKPDIVHAQNIVRALPACVIKAILGKPYVVYGRGSDIYFLSSFNRLIYRIAVSRASMVIAQTEDMKRSLCKLYSKDIVVIPNGVEVSKFAECPREGSRRQLRIGETERVLLFAGRLEPIKGVKYLIEAMSLICQEDKVRLLIVGEGGERQMLETLAARLKLTECISFQGQVFHNIIPQYMAAADIFILPSLSEGFPVTSLEAMASGLPIIATKVRGMPEIIAEGENGFLVPPRNPEKLAEKILLLLNNSELREKIARNNREKARKYSWENVAKKLEEVYTNIKIKC